MCFEPNPKMAIPYKDTGYKVFRVDKLGKLKGEFTKKKKQRKFNQWLSEEDFRPNNNEKGKMNDSVLTGWRIFLKKGDAQEWAQGESRLRVVKVKFSGVLTRGFCRYCGIDLPAILAKEIFIPKEQ